MLSNEQWKPIIYKILQRFKYNDYITVSGLFPYVVKNWITLTKILDFMENEKLIKKLYLFECPVCNFNEILDKEEKFHECQNCGSSINNDNIKTIFVINNKTELEKLKKKVNWLDYLLN
ncbi:hypothetical protein X275_01095 [Marinitoga sp. 1197]|uniref:hypothetical protein n=1 Tax=Marinitoga sp. 1197 TaxID=1428449 RepID=UPI0006416F67|nr:hypothetical protein [Marinitoga sp. 1197]AJW76946.1 hypothetical protein UF08_57 [Marinitoga camini virus 1]KLO24025.1 hypothetical protein X275_01095 [Marinitoga sp. 1197]